MGELRQRKPNRLIGYDYSKNGAYYITVCIKDRHEILWKTTVGANCVRPQYNTQQQYNTQPQQDIELSKIGKIVENEITHLDSVYDSVSVDCFVIMPNHIHMILVITSDGRTQFAPTLSRVIKQWKGVITTQIGFSMWQKSFHDHIIRNVSEYKEIAEYIENNQSQWEKDCFYPK